METNVGKYGLKLYTSPSFLEGLKLIMELKTGDYQYNCSYKDKDVAQNL